MAALPWLDKILDGHLVFGYFYTTPKKGLIICMSLSLQVVRLLFAIFEGLTAIGSRCQKMATAPGAWRSLPPARSAIGLDYRASPNKTGSSIST